jgi:PAS domain S-box-containing protein
LRDETGNIVKWYGTNIDIEDRKQADEKLRQSEREARQILDLSPMHLSERWPDGTRRYNNQAGLDYLGLTLDEWLAADLQTLVHPQDAERAASDLAGKFQSESPFEYEARLRRSDGQYRWFHFRCNPMLDDQGHITRWYAAGSDIEDRKVAEQRLREENISLREEIDKASMFEEIVGISAPLKKVVPGYPRWLRRTPACSLPARRAQARNWWRAPSTGARGDPHAHL